MDLVLFWDDQDRKVAYDLYHCDGCGKVLLKNRWEGPKEVWIDPENGLGQEE
jgi:hypothetical protein